MVLKVLPRSGHYREAIRRVAAFSGALYSRSEMTHSVINQKIEGNYPIAETQHRWVPKAPCPTCRHTSP